MTLVYIIAMILAAYLIGLGIGVVKNDSGKHEVLDFMIGYSIVIICSIIYLMIK